jgi:hypothetical protein
MMARHNLDFKRDFFTEWSDITQSTIAILCAVALVGTPLFYVWLIFKYQFDDDKRKSIMKEYRILFEGLRTTFDASLFYLVFYLNRLMNIIYMVCFHEHPIFVA